MTTSSEPPVVILSDFDGTISAFDVSDFIYSRFAACGLFYAEQWAKGEISTREEVLLTYATVTAGQAEIAAGLAEVPIDPTFHELVDFAQSHGIELAVVSDGMDWVIGHILAANGIHGLRIFANHIIFGEHGLDFEFPWWHDTCPMDGVCKPQILQSFRDAGKHIIYIGDGRSDRMAAAEADLVFAKNELAAYCREQGIAAQKYSNFHDICDWLAHDPATAARIFPVKE